METPDRTAGTRRRVRAPDGTLVAALAELLINLATARRYRGRRWAGWWLPALPTLLGVPIR
jgi:hypothetical protein